MNKVITIILGITLGLTIFNTYCIANLLRYSEIQNRIEAKEVAIIDALTKDVWGDVTK